MTFHYTDVNAWNNKALCSVTIYDDQSWSKLILISGIYSENVCAAIINGYLFFLLESISVLVLEKS